MRLFFMRHTRIGETRRPQRFGTDQSFESCRGWKRRGTSSRSIDLKLISIVRVPLRQIPRSKRNDGMILSHD